MRPQNAGARSFSLRAPSWFCCPGLGYSAGGTGTALKGVVPVATA
jgi:hypothetical protein